MFLLTVSCLTMFTLIHGPSIPGSYVVLFLASDFTFVTRHSHNRASFLLWSSHFFFSGAIGSHPPFFPSSIWDTLWPGELIFWCRIFLCFYTVHEVLTEGILRWFAFPSSNGSRFVGNLHYDPSVWGGPTRHGSWLRWVKQTSLLQQGSDLWRRDPLCIEQLKSANRELPFHPAPIAKGGPLCNDRSVLCNFGS